MIKEEEEKGEGNYLRKRLACILSTTGRQAAGLTRYFVSKRASLRWSIAWHFARISSIFTDEQQQALLGTYRSASANSSRSQEVEFNRFKVAEGKETLFQQFCATWKSVPLTGLTGNSRPFEALLKGVCTPSSLLVST